MESTAQSVDSTSSQFQVTPTTSNVFDMHPNKMSESDSIILLNPIYLPDDSSIAGDNFQAQQNEDSLTTRQEHLFDAQLDECIKEPQSIESSYQYVNWDDRITAPENDVDLSNSDWAIQLLKVIVYNIAFIVILSSAVISKCTTLLMTSMVQAKRSIPVCNSNQTNHALLIDPPLDSNQTYSVRYEANSVHRIAWLWCLYFATITPYVFAFLRSIRLCCFRKFNIPKVGTTVIVFTMETLHIIGLSMLIFIILPNFDAIRGAMMLSSVCTVPSLIRLFVMPKAKSKKQNTSKMLGIASDRFSACFTFALQVLSLAVWTVIDHYEQITGKYHALPVCLFLVSFEWWENYLVPNQMCRFVAFLDNARQDLQKSRNFLSLFITPWKCFLLFLLMLCHEYIAHGEEVARMMFSNFTDGFRTNQVIIKSDKQPEFVPYMLDYEIHHLTGVNSLAPLYFMLAHIIINYVCYWFVKYACQIWIQKIAFAIPMTLTIPLSVTILWKMNRFALDDPCGLVQIVPMFQYVFWYTHLDFTFLFHDNINRDWLYIGVAVIWFLGTQFACTRHIWKVNSEKLATSDQLFVSPKYNSVLIDQSLTLNRRRVKLVFTGEEVFEENETDDDDDDVLPNLNRRPTLAEIQWQEYLAQREKQKEDWAREWTQICAYFGLDEDGIDPKPNPEEDDIVRIYACATMWHEDKNEMLQMLKAVMRLDFDQYARRIARDDFDESEEYYELEGNIFFDDAFEGKTMANGRKRRVINQFVEQLIEVMNEAAAHVFGSIKVVVDYPTIVNTPYGGKLIWKLPGGNKLIAHLKDKRLIRDRKRWSQCMYMYYLLQHRLTSRGDLSELRKLKIANNTFILALDGDIQFQPSALHMVVDLMKKNSKLGAACGRIHPIGSGLMVWYQKFEYSIGHWFQKATEHVFGCVLCSPGCFSLFRARALMDVNVMAKYKTKSSEALHYVQYDQGEDRWLCTLLLQRGWKIEYCAASDSYTHAPEGFRDFYIQRRRWAPSTMANIIDLLSDYKQTVKVNDNISFPYIAYQAFLMFGSILSPATIVLMVVTAMNTAMQFSLSFSIASNLIVILVFTFVCYYLDSDKDHIKINFAMVLSTIYGLLMCSVLTGTAIEMVENGPLSPNSLFFTAMIISFILAGFIHPNEFGNVFLFPIYMLLIPSMYLLLTIYSVTNMHIVKWGTREVKTDSSPEELAKQMKADNGKTNKSKVQNWLDYIDPRKYTKQRSGLLSCMCCSVGTSTSAVNCMCCSGNWSQYQNGLQFEQIEDNIAQLTAVVTQIQSQLPQMAHNNLQKMHSELSTTSPLTKPKQVEFQSSTPQTSISEIDYQELTTDDEYDDDDNENPYWIVGHDKLKTFQRKQLHYQEQQFWVNFINNYLYPLKISEKERQQIEIDLINLRNKTLFAFGFLNVLVVLAFFILQAHESLKMKFYIGSQEIEMHPIGFWLVIFFGSLLLVQCIGMLVHRFGTLTQLLAFTQIDLFKNKQVNMANLVKKVIKLSLQNQKDINGESASPESTIREESYEAKRRRSQNIQLDNVFKKQVKMIKREPSQFSNPNTGLDIHEFSRLNSRPAADRATSLLQRKMIKNNDSTEVLIQNEETQNVKHTYRKKLSYASKSLRIKSTFKQFTGSLRQLRSRTQSLSQHETNEV